MNDYNFQKQLHTLKERVSELSSNRSPAMGKNEDPFIRELHELKAQLASMQDRCSKFQDSMYSTQSTTGAGQRSVDRSTYLPPHNMYHIPASSPASQLDGKYQELNLQLQALIQRVGSIEHAIPFIEDTVSNLEDKMDGMDPNRFTPAESNSGHESAFPWNGSSNTSNKTPYSCVQELSSDSASHPLPRVQPSTVGIMCTEPYDAFGFHRPEMKLTSPEIKRAAAEFKRYLLPRDGDTRSRTASAGSVENDVLSHAAATAPPVGTGHGSEIGTFAPSISTGKASQKPLTQMNPAELLKLQDQKRALMARQEQPPAASAPSGNGFQMPPPQPDSYQSQLLQQQAKKIALIERQEQDMPKSQGQEQHSTLPNPFNQDTKGLPLEEAYMLALGREQMYKQECMLRRHDDWMKLHGHTQDSNQSKSVDQDAQEPKSQPTAFESELLKRQDAVRALMLRQGEDTAKVQKPSSTQLESVDQNTETDNGNGSKNRAYQYLPENPVSDPPAPSKTSNDKKRALMDRNDLDGFEGQPSMQSGFGDDAAKPQLDTGEDWRRLRPQSPKRKIFKTDDEQHDKSEAKPNGGVAFRDREIGRMDEQLRIVQERLRENEEILAQKEARISRMQNEREYFRRTFDQHESRTLELQRTLEAQRTEIGDLHSRIDRSNHDLIEYEKGWRACHDLYERTKEKEKTYREALRQQRMQQYSYVNRLTRAHEGEIKRLQTLCDNKDVALSKQDKIIAECHQLLSDRNEKIERLQRENRAGEADKENAIRNVSRMARWLAEKDEELSQIRGRLPNGYAKRGNSVTFDDDTQSSNFNSVEVEQSESEAPGYSAAKVHRYKYPIYETPGGEQRSDSTSAAPYLWDTTIPEYGHPQFANPGPHCYTSVGKRRERGSRRHKASRDDLGDYWRLPSQSHEESSGFLEPVERRTDPLCSQLSDATLRPPLPAPPLGTARRMASEADLRGASRTNRANLGQNKLAKHQSMLELRGNRLQAYVETEPESSGEFGGEV